VNELCVSPPSLPREGKRVPLYIVREIQASQDEWSKHTRKGGDKVDEHEETDEGNNTRERDKVDEHREAEGRQTNK
jgi:hypothetical protein